MKSTLVKKIHHGGWSAIAVDNPEGISAVQQEDAEYEGKEEHPPKACRQKRKQTKVEKIFFFKML